MKAAFYYFLLWALTGLMGCRTSEVLHVDASSDFDLSKYSTFSFFDVDIKADTVGERFRQNVDILKRAIAQELSGKGLQESTEAEADILVNIGITIEEEVQTRETSLLTDPGTFNYIGQRRYTWKSETIEVNRYKEGTVAVHLVDKAKNKMVWYGVVEDVIPRKQPKINRTIEEAMRALFDRL